MVWLQVLVNGLIAGAIYALVALGFSLIYSTNRFMHFAHGAVVALGAYLVFLFFSVLKFDFWLAVLATVVLSALMGGLLNELFYKPLRQRKASSAILLIASVVLLIVLESFILLFFGADVKTIGFLPIEKGVEIAGAIITPLQMVVIAVSVLLFIGLFLFLKKTRLGKALRAVADNPQTAEVFGISSEKMFSYSFLIGSAIAGLAGILVGLEQNLAPTMGTNLVIKGFTGAVIGGVGNVPASVLGSFLLGIVENFGILFLPSGYKDAIAFVILFLFLIVRPQGLLGIKKGEHL